MTDWKSELAADQLMLRTANSAERGGQQSAKRGFPLSLIKTFPD
jgi:hypothetical protein